MIAVTLRPARDQDAEAMASIAGLNPTTPQWTAAQFRETLEEGRTLRRSVLVAEQAGEVAGFAVASALSNVFPVEAELESIAVAPAQQGHGIGRRLLEATLQWAAAQNAETIRLEARASNDRALGIYERSGFHLIGRRPGYYAAPVEDAVVMERTISVSSGDVPTRSLV
jgi:ribosomal-protein-alanine N-acetyltransferase